jgi:type IV secretion system protein VirB9
MRQQAFTGAVLLASVIGFATPTLAERTPRSMGADARVRAVTHSEADVIRVDLNLRVNTAIELGAGERISSVLIGDSEAFEVEVLSNRQTISIKPMIAGAQTNLIVYTGRRAITLSLIEGRSNTPTYRVVLQYPDAQPRRVAAATSRDIGYGYSGDGEIRPLRVWNNGNATFFEFAPGVRPSVFGVDARGYEITLNSQTRGAIVRVSGVRDAYSIRIGDQVICIRRMTGGVTTLASEIQPLTEREF